MQATYPRESNLDNRFDDTAAITFSQLSWPRGRRLGDRPGELHRDLRIGRRARQFIGYWHLVLVDGQWLLAEPHY